MKLELTSLEKSIKSLSESIEVFEKYQNTKDEKLKRSLKESVIQTFEVSYEMCKKMLRRYISMYKDEKIDQLTIIEMFKLSEKFGLLSSSEDWFEYRAKRNVTSHTYDAGVAEDVFDSAKLFLEDAKIVFQKLKEKIES